MGLRQVLSTLHGEFAGTGAVSEVYSPDAGVKLYFAVSEKFHSLQAGKHLSAHAGKIAGIHINAYAVTAMRSWIELAFRIFFALNFIGVVVALIRQLHSHPVLHSHIPTTVEIAGIMCAAVALATAFSLWMAKSRDTKE